MNVLESEFFDKIRISPGGLRFEEGISRAERIAKFNAFAIETGHLDGATSAFNFRKKLNIGNSSSLSPLAPLKLSKLEVEVTHRGCVVYGRIATKVLKMASIMVLIEDESDLVNLAVYGDECSVSEFTIGRSIAIKEPYLKIRQDGSKGIRVDNMDDIVFDPPEPDKYPDIEQVSNVTKPPRARGTATERLQEILLLEDGKKGVDKLYQQLSDEGYVISKKQIKALKKNEFVRKNESSPKTNCDPTLDVKTTKKEESVETMTPIISERRPEKHRILKSKNVLRFKDLGNEAMHAKRYEEAEQFYTKAIDYRNDHSDDSVPEIYLWQLYSNRSAARMKLGKLFEAFEDSLSSNICAPACAVKPLLRCAEAMVALGLCREAIKLLSNCEVHFPDDISAVAKKKESLQPAQVLVVGDGGDFKTIGAAIRVAVSGAEIIVRPGIYRECLHIDKPISLICPDIDDYEAIKSKEGGIRSQWAEIRAIGTNGIIVNCESAKALHIVGFKVTCGAPPGASFHSVTVMSGNTVLRNCSFTSSSGPVICAQFPTSNLTMQGCLVQGGAQGGILAVDGARLYLQQVHCCDNAAAGLELRTESSASLESCHFYNNGRQGIMLWQNASSLTAKNCEIHSHHSESGALVSEARATFNHCKFYGNAFCGAVSQEKGELCMVGCEVFSNCEGILIQGSGHAIIDACDVHSNRANGIFVGFDHKASAKLRKNKVYNNFSKGILLGNSKKVIVHDNHEHSNRGFPPQLPNNIRPESATINKHYLKRVKKNHKQHSMSGNVPNSFLDAMVTEQNETYSMQDIVEDLGKKLKMCAFCDTEPPEGKPFAKCSRCAETSYCSKECQKRDWSNHKKICQMTNVKYPSFLDRNQSV